MSISQGSNAARKAMQTNNLISEFDKLMKQFSTTKQKAGTFRKLVNWISQKFSSRNGQRQQWIFEKLKEMKSFPELTANDIKIIRQVSLVELVAIMQTRVAQSGGYPKLFGGNKIQSWQSMMNAQTYAQINSSSNSKAVQIVFMDLMGCILQWFVPNLATILSLPFKVALKKQFPELNIKQIDKLASTKYKNRYTFSQVLMFPELKLGCQSLTLSQVNTPPRPEQLYVWNDVFVINTATQSPYKQNMAFFIEQKQVNLGIQYQFDVQKRTITSCQLLFGGKKLEYVINDTDQLWKIAQSLFKTKLQFQKSTIAK